MIHITTVILFALIIEAHDLSDRAIVLCSRKVIVNQLTALYQQIDNVWQHSLSTHKDCVVNMETTYQNLSYGQP